MQRVGPLPEDEVWDTFLPQLAALPCPWPLLKPFFLPLWLGVEEKALWASPSPHGVII